MASKGGVPIGCCVCVWCHGRRRGDGGGGGDGGGVLGDDGDGR